MEKIFCNGKADLGIFGNLVLISYQHQVYQVYAVCMFTVCVCGFVIMGTDCISLSFHFFFTVCCPDNTFGPTCQGNRILLLIPLSPFSLSLPSLSSFSLSLFLLPPSFFLPSLSLSFFSLPLSSFLLCYRMSWRSGPSMWGSGYM